MRTNVKAPPPDSGGFVLVFVIMMLLGITMSGAAAYLVVRSEATMAKYSAHSAEALAVARAGLHRFVAEEIGPVNDSASYSIGNGIAVVTARKVIEQDSTTHLYYVRSEAQVKDAFSSGFPATRVVAAFATHNLRPIPEYSPLVLSVPTIDLGGSSTQVHAVDSSTVADCPGGGASPIMGAIALDTVKGGSLVGTPQQQGWNSYQAMYDSIDLRWDVLTNSNLIVDVETNDPADLIGFPADQYVVIRYPGDRRFTSDWNRRGVLIVTGAFSADASFDWEGVILAGDVTNYPPVGGQIRGMVIGGLNGEIGGGTLDWRADVYYYSCHVDGANEALSYLSLVENTIYEVH